MTQSIARPAQSIGKAEFVALVAMLVAAVAFSIDAMLPAMPRIAEELTPEAPNLAQLIITSFVLGLGVGTFFAGPLSDSFGRKPVILVGSALYIGASALALAAPSLELVLLARVLQGFGASAARIVPMAIVRDLYSGRAMAQIVSFIMMVFTLVPAVAPLLGSGIIAFAGWRAIFVAFMVFAIISAVWLATRVIETWPEERRRPFRAASVFRSARTVMSNRTVQLCTAAQALCMVALFASLSSIHQIFDATYQRAETFPWWFALMALAAGAFSLLNAMLVIRLGMKRLLLTAMGSLIALTVAMLLLETVILTSGLPFLVYFLWQGAVFIHTSMTLGNLNALAMEPMGEVAGMAASAITGLATIGAVFFTIPIGLAFDGTPVPLMIGTLLATIAAFLLSIRIRES
jgi:DHA1 family bicyclomycin/chloramphenicol resistance-like MFS transporter